VSSEQLYSDQAAAASKVLAAWFDDARFKAAWQPDPSLMVTDQQVAVAQVCAAKGTAVDRDGVVYLLSRSEKWKRLAADPDDLFRVMEGPFVLNPWAELERLQEIAAARALRVRLVEATRAIEGGTGLAEARTLVSASLNESALGSGAKPRTRREVMHTALHNATTGREMSRGARTVSRALDKVTGGLRKRKFWVIGAASNWGKTSLLVALDNQFVCDGYRTLIVSGEDEEELFGQRMLGVGTGVDAIHMRDGNLSDAELRSATNAVKYAADQPCFLDVTGLPAEKVAADIRSLILSEGIDFVLIDYAQVFRLAQRAQRDTRRDELWHIARLFKEAVKGAGAGGILFSQITEDEKSGKVKTRDAEDLEHLADVVLFGKSEFEQGLGSDGQKGQRIEKKSVFVKKVKNGPKWFPIPLNWDPQTASFRSDYDDPRAASELPFEEREWEERHGAA
jgi:replicative DNA helicase